MSAEVMAEAYNLMSDGDLRGALDLVGRNTAPYLLLEWFDTGEIYIDEVRPVLLDVWQMAEWPCQLLPRKQWLSWFRSAGYLTEVGDCSWTGTKRLYRAQVGRTMGLSWTPDREIAQWYHDRNANYFQFPNARLLERDVRWSAVLATLNDRTEGRLEVLVDPEVRK